MSRGKARGNPLWRETRDAGVAGLRSGWAW
jgi:hypothetical protein